MLRLVAWESMMRKGFKAEMWMPTFEGLVHGQDETTLRFYWYRIRLPKTLGFWIVGRKRLGGDDGDDT